MRSFVPDYEIVTPRDVEHALRLLPDCQPFAGGTDLMVSFEAGKLTQTRFVNLWGLRDLKPIEVSPDHVTLGALTTYTEVQRSKVLQQEFPMLCRAAAETGGIAIQNRGTLGGNIANASPAADSPPALLAYDAQIELTSRNGSRWIPYEHFHTGYKQMDMRPDELLTRIRLARNGGDGVHYYRKVGTRKAQAISKICFAAYANKQHVRIGMGSVAPTVIRTKHVEELIQGRAVDQELITQAREAVLRDIAPIDDIRSTIEYRSRVTANLMEDFLSQLAQA